MKKGQKVYWYYNGKQYSGTLDERFEVVGVQDADKYIAGAGIEDVSYFTWDITGDDLKSYSVKESELYTEPIKN